MSLTRDDWGRADDDPGRAGTDMTDEDRAPWTRELDERLSAFREALLDDVRRMIAGTAVVGADVFGYHLVPPQETSEVGRVEPEDRLHDSGRHRHPPTVGLSAGGGSGVPASFPPQDHDGKENEFALTPEQIAHGKELVQNLNSKCGAESPPMTIHCNEPKGHGGSLHTWTGGRVRWSKDCPDSGPAKEAARRLATASSAPAPQRGTATEALSAEEEARRIAMSVLTDDVTLDQHVSMILALVKRERDRQHCADYTAVSRTDPRDGETAIAYYRRALANLMAVPHGLGER